MSKYSVLVKNLRSLGSTFVIHHQAADAIEAQAKRIAELEVALKNCADDLEAELRARYEFVKPIRPAENKRFQRDMATVIAARAALGQNKP